MTPRADDALISRLYLSGLSQAQVAAHVGCTPKTVITALRRRGTSSRTLKEASRKTPFVPLSTVQGAVLDGLMLGDGCLTIGRNALNAVLQITRSANDLEYQNWLSQVFLDRLTKRGVSIRDVFDSRTGKTYRSTVLRTRSDPVFTEARQRWYPQGRKQVPADLVLTSQAVAVWVADDGHVRAASRRSPDIKFATQGFSHAEVHRLANVLSERYAGKTHVYQEANSGQYTIRVWGFPARALLRDIDPVFPPMNRKSEHWRNSELLVEKNPPPKCPRCASTNVYLAAKTRRGIQQYKCQVCMRSWRETYERTGRDPRLTRGV